MASNIVLTMEGTLLNWLKNVGDSVSAGEVVAEVEADKATVEITAPAAGVISQVSAQVGDELKEGAVLGVISEGGAAASPPPAADAPAPTETGAPAPAPAVPVPTAQPAAAQPTAQGNGTAASVTPEGRVKASPVARNVAADKGIDLAQVAGTGPGGRITRADVESFQPGAAPVAPMTAPADPNKVDPKPQHVATAVQIAGMPVRKAPEGPDVEIMDISKMRQRIATNTVESKQWVPHFYVTSDMHLDPLLQLRQQINAGIGENGVKISVNDMIVKATALALRKFPNLNTHYYGDKLVRHKKINIGIAVALPQGGLMNVVSKDADKISLSALAQMNKEMIARARDGKVKPEDIQGSTFTTSNLGPYDIEHFIAIINPPEAGIIAIGSGLKAPVVLPDGTVGVQTRIKITISVDHRVSDGAEGAQYLQELRSFIENPMRLL